MLKTFTVVMSVLQLFTEGFSERYCNERSRFRCQNGLCLSKAFVCNGAKECELGEDELNCRGAARCLQRQNSTARLNKFYQNGGCRKRCSSDAACKGRKTCTCDDECGFSCVNINVECLTEPPSIPHMARYIVYRSSWRFKLRTRKSSAPYIYGSFVEYVCDRGYRLEGPAPRCNGRGRWSGEIPTCVIDFSECGQVGEVMAPTSLVRVVGGEDAEENAWPWQVLITKRDDNMKATLSNDVNVMAGGSIINEHWVLTAAHVMNSIRNYVIFVGLTERPGADEVIKDSIQSYAIDEFIPHSSYDRQTYKNDIALIRVGARLDLNMNKIEGRDNGLTYTNSIRPVCLPCIAACSDKKRIVGEDTASMLADKVNEEEKCRNEENLLLSNNMTLIVTGFGHVYRTEGRIRKVHPSKRLQQASLKILDRTSCKSGIRKIRKEWQDAPDNLQYTKNMICCNASDTENVADACQGDSGGPVVRRVEYSAVEGTETVRNPSWVLVGVVSFGYGCARSDVPGYYTNVARYIPWLNGITKGELQSKLKPCSNGVSYEGKLYFAVLEGVWNKDGAERICIDEGGRLADVLDADHQTGIEIHVRRRYPHEPHVHLWTGMTYQLWGGTLGLTNGSQIAASALRWDFGYPSGLSTGIMIQIFQDESAASNGLLNISDDEAMGVLCQK